MPEPKTFFWDKNISAGNAGSTQTMHVERIGTLRLNLSVLGKLYQPHSVICGSDFLNLFEELSSKDNGVGQNTLNSPDRVLQNYSQACSIVGLSVSARKFIQDRKVFLANLSRK